MKLELEIEKLQEKLNTFEATEVEETKTPSSLSIKLNVISGQRFGMVPQGSKIQVIKYPRREEALSGVKDSQARLMIEVKARNIEKPQELAKKKNAVVEVTSRKESKTAAQEFKIEYEPVARDSLNRVQQVLGTK